MSNVEFFILAKAASFQREEKKILDNPSKDSYRSSMNNGIVSEKGQITIPKALRTKLGLAPGAVLEFSAVNGKLVAHKKLALDVFKKWRGRGRLPKAMTVDRYLQRARDAHSH